MNEVAFQELLLDARTSESVSGLRKLVLASALRGDFDDQTERQHQLSDALNSIHALAAPNRANKVRSRKNSSEINPAEELLSGGNEFVVELGAIATIEKGRTGIKDAAPGVYPLVVTAEGRLTADHFDFEGPAVIIPLVSSTGHGDASLKRIHYQDGKYAVGSILCAVQSRLPEVVHPRYLYEYLSTFKEELLVSRMSGTANVSLTVGKIAEVPVPLITYEAQEKLDRLMSLCDALEASGQLETQQHAQLVNTLLGTLTQSETPEALADNWQRIATHFDLLLDRPEAVDALEQTILQLAVRGLLVPQDPSDEPASVLLQEIRTGKDHLIAQGKIKRDKPLPPINKETQPCKLPLGWSWVRLSELGEFGGGKTPSTQNGAFWDGDIPWITPKDMKQLRLSFSEDRVTQTAVDDGLTLIPSNSVLMVVRSGILRRTVPTAINEVATTINQDLKALVLIEPELANYIQLLIRGFEGFILKHLTKVGTTVESIQFEAFAAQAFPLPPLAEQSRIVTRVNELHALCTDLRQRLSAAQSTQGHLADALVGN